MTNDQTVDQIKSKNREGDFAGCNMYQPYKRRYLNLYEIRSGVKFVCLYQGIDRITLWSSSW